MDSERWKKIEQLYDSAIALKAGDRAAYLQQVCAGDDSLYQEVNSLLACHEPSEQYLETPAYAAADWLTSLGSQNPEANTQPPPDIIGQTISRYRIIAKLGGGGMGVVYEAEDLSLERHVALKFLPPHMIDNPEALERFQGEARAASALNHPHICTIHEIAKHNEIPFIAMELLQGQTLGDRISSKPLPIDQLLDLGIQIADALEAAHSREIIHRDVKPANIFITPSGQAKILDFGVAKRTGKSLHIAEMVGASPVPTLGLTADYLTSPGAVMGTVAYMSPEQLRGEELDARSDLFSFGTVLYEMATGHRAFLGNTSAVVFDAILNEKPKSPLNLNTNLPPKVAKIIEKALAKDRQIRYQSAREIRLDLTDVSRQISASVFTQRPITQLIRKPRFAVPILLLLLALLVASILIVRRNAQVRWATRQAIPEIARLLDNEKYVPAFHLARKVERYISDDPVLTRLRHDTLILTTVHTTPPGADVYVKEFDDVSDAWEYLGRSPIEGIKIPLAHYRWRVSKAGFDTVEASFQNGRPVDFILDPEGNLPPGMVRIPGGRTTASIAGGPEVQVDDYLMDKFELTNAEFKKFLDAGGYQKREYWKEPFVKGDRLLSWENAITEFRDSTGQPGPATWEVGDFPHGQSDLPVDGVSWYEAAAYAQFAGKSLPTVYHWRRAAGNSAEVLPLSNFGDKGPVRVGTYQGIGPYGTYDMAGNIREWCWNELHGQRYIMGGAWNEPTYVFNSADALSPFDRSATNGIRLMKNLVGEVSGAAKLPIENIPHDFNNKKPVSDETFVLFRSFYSYDHAPLQSVVESAEDGPLWKKERVTFSAAYMNERVTAYLFLPKNANPPFRTVIYFPSAPAFHRYSFENFDTLAVDFIIKSGRAVLYPIYKGSFERIVKSLEGLNNERDLVIQWSKDLSRSIDYLATRGDIDHDRLAYYGTSRGANFAPVLLAMEPRIKVAVLLSGGLLPRVRLPEVDAINFAPRVKIPVLMLNGRHDILLPVNSSQVPFFQLLGTPTEDKRHVLFDGGHTMTRNNIVKEVLGWLDRYLGPVNMRLSTSRRDTVR